MHPRDNHTSSEVFVTSMGWSDQFSVAIDVLQNFHRFLHRTAELLADDLAARAVVSHPVERDQRVD